MVFSDPKLEVDVEKENKEFMERSEVRRSLVIFSRNTFAVHVDYLNLISGAVRSNGGLSLECSRQFIVGRRSKNCHKLKSIFLDSYFLVASEASR